MKQIDINSYVPTKHEILAFNYCKEVWPNLQRLATQFLGEARIYKPTQVQGYPNNNFVIGIKVNSKSILQALDDHIDTYENCFEDTDYQQFTDCDFSYAGITLY